MIFNEFIRHFKIYFFVGIITFGLFGIVNQINHEIYNFEHPDIQDIITFGKYKFLIVVVPTISFLLAVFSSLLDILVIRKILHKKSLGFIVLVGIIIQFQY